MIRIWSSKHCAGYLPLGVEDIVLLEDLGNDGHCRVDRVRDNKDERFGRSLCDGGSEIADDATVDLSQALSSAL